MIRLRLCILAEMSQSDAVSFSVHHIRSYMMLVLEEIIGLEKSLLCNHHSNHLFSQESSIGAKSSGGKYDGNRIFTYTQEILPQITYYYKGENMNFTVENLVHSSS